MTVPWQLMGELARQRQQDLLVESERRRVRREARLAAREARRNARALGQPASPVVVPFARRDSAPS